MKRIWILLLISLLSLTGCLAGGEIREQEFEPIDLTDWPMPVATNTPEPTPELVRVILTPTPVSSQVQTPITTTSVLAVEESETISADTFTDITTQSSTRPSLAVIGIAAAMGDNVSVRQGPGRNHSPVDTLTQGELAGIYGRDATGQWLYVQTLSRAFGWLAYGDVRTLDTLADAPVLPPDLLANLSVSTAGSTQSATANSVETTSSIATEATVRQPLELNTLTTIATARVSSASLNIRQRPGVDFQRFGSLPQGEELSILAVNRDKLWVLVQTSMGQFGWVYINGLDLNDLPDNSLQVTTLAPDANHPNDQVAPVVPLTSSSVSAVPASSPATASNPAVVAAVVDSPSPTASLPGNTLAVKTTANVDQKIDLRRGPATTYGAVDELTVDEMVTVRATNERGDWLVVETRDSGAVGWASVDALTVAAPVDSSAYVVSGWIESNDVRLRNGPGIIYGEIGPVAINDFVSILALNEGRNWLLVETLSGGQGWLPLNLVEVSGSLNNLPELSSPPVADGRPRSLPPANVAPPARTGQLVVQTASGGDIMIIDADGSNLRRLTHGIDPVLSPDGQQVAFTRWVGDVSTLWVINVDGSGERAIVGEMRKAKGPAWSPDGTQIVVNFQQGGRLEDKRVCRTNGQPPPNAFDVVGGMNDEGKFVLCWSLPLDPHWTLRVINVADGRFEDADGGTYAFRPTWDPNQPWRVVSDGGLGLVSADINQDRIQKLTEQVKDGSPVFSPDGRHLVVTVGNRGADKGHDLHRLNADGGGRVQLTETPFWLPLEPETEGVLWNNVAATWSPEGDQIAFVTDREGRWEIWLMNADGSNQRPMFSDEINDQLQIRYDFNDERVISWQ